MRITIQLMFADRHGLEMTSNRVILHFDTREEKPKISHYVSKVRKVANTLAPIQAEQCQIRDERGNPWTPWLSLDRE